jgi:hypothetical protein
MPIDTRELRARPGFTEHIAGDRLCGRCRYNLKGLPTNGRCPECGTPIVRSGRRRFTDNLSDAPMFYIKGLGVGAALLAVFSIVGLRSFSLLELRQTLLLAAISGASAVAWWVGVFIITGRRQAGENPLPDAILDSPHLRLVNRALQAAWVLAAMAWFMAIRFPPPVSQVAYHGAIVLQLIGTCGLIPLAIHLSCIADWAGDNGLSDRFRISAWALALFGLLSFLGRFFGTISTTAGAISVIRGFLWMGSIWASLALAVVMLLFIFCLLQLAWTCLWAISNSRTAAATSRRILERSEKELRAMAERTHQAAALNPPPPIPKRPKGKQPIKPFETGGESAL